MNRVDIKHALEFWEEILTIDGFDDAILGINSNTGVVYYSKEKIIDILISEGMSQIDAIEHADFNIFNNYVGKNTPVFLEDFFITQIDNTTNERKNDNQ